MNKTALDTSKAFDTVWHTDLERLLIPGEILYWFSFSYLATQWLLTWMATLLDLFL